MKLPCEAVRDLLPLYAEGLTSEASDRLLAEHLKDCADCKKELETLRCAPAGNEPPQNGAALLRVKKDIKKRKLRTAAFSVLCAFLLLFMAFSYLTKPHCLSYADSDVHITTEADGRVYASFSEQVTACRTNRYINEEGKVSVDVEAWSSYFDHLLGKASPSVLLASKEEPADVVYYCDYTVSSENMTVVYGAAGDVGGQALPRLVMGYYALIALIASVVLGVLFLLLRKKKTVGTITKALFLVPVSYLLGQLLLANRFVTYFAARDFVMNCIAGAAVYGVLWLGSSLIWQRRRDAAEL